MVGHLGSESKPLKNSRAVVNNSKCTYGGFLGINGELASWCQVESRGKWHEGACSSSRQFLVMVEAGDCHLESQSHTAFECALRLVNVQLEKKTVRRHGQCQSRFWFCLRHFNFHTATGPSIGGLLLSILETHLFMKPCLSAKTGHFPTLLAMCCQTNMVRTRQLPL